MATKKAAPKKKVPAKKAVRRTRGQNADPESGLSRLLDRRTGEGMRADAKHRRDIFVEEYLFDFCAARAWRRMHARLNPEDETEHTASYAAERGYQLMREPYVELKLREVVDQMEEAKMLSRNRVLAMILREANYFGGGAQHGARVSATGMLAKIVQLLDNGGGGNGGKKKDDGPRGNVMIVPEVQDTNTWEKRAQAAQAQLKAEVRD